MINSRQIATMFCVGLGIMLSACGNSLNIETATVAESAEMVDIVKDNENTEDITMNDPTAAIKVLPEDEYYIFDLDDTVNREHVYYRNRFGIEIAADLYTSKDMDMSDPHPAIVVGPPFGGVKEQGPGVYANKLAQRGFVVLAFDPAYHGYSGGQPRMTASTTMYAEDFSAAVDYLSTQGFVDSEKIGAIGICGSGGFALSAAAMDTRIKAIATMVMYDIAGSNNAIEGDQRRSMLSMSVESRQKGFESGDYEYFKSYPDAPASEIPAELDPVSAEFFSFYGMKRGWHPNALGNVTLASFADLMTFPSNQHISEISPRPILFVVGENAHSKEYSEDAFEKAGDAKELYVVPDANHVDLYDNVTKIPFDKIDEFFIESM